MDETQPESGFVSYQQYDDAGNLLQKTDANLTRFQYGYDTNERLASVTATTATGTTRTTQIVYELGSDNREQANVVGVVSTLLQYDAAGRLKARQDNIGARAYGRTFEYDGNDNLMTLSYPSGRKVQYGYDSENRIVSVTDVGHRDVATGFSYHPSGAVKSFASGNQVGNSFDYDVNRYWVRAIAAGSLSLGYGYDHVGNATSIADSRPGFNQTFGYDPLYRLTSAGGGANWPAQTFSYDFHGNRTGTSYDYDAAKLRLLRRDNLNFTYDNNGNMKSSNNDTYSFTPDNLLDSSNVQNTLTSYVYDADGWREKMTVTGGTTSYFLRGAHGELLSEMRNPESSPKSMRDYVYAGSRLLAVITVDGDAK
jgi:YD repeat-containing protein